MSQFRIKEIEVQLRELAQKEVVTQFDINVAKKLIQERHDLLNPQKVKR